VKRRRARRCRAPTFALAELDQRTSLRSRASISLMLPPLAGGRGLLVVLVLAAMRLVPLLHGLALLRGQERFRLLVGVAMDCFEFGLLLIGAQRRIVVHGGDLRLGAFVDFPSSALSDYRSG